PFLWLFSLYSDLPILVLYSTGNQHLFIFKVSSFLLKKFLCLCISMASLYSLTAIYFMFGNSTKTECSLLRMLATEASETLGFKTGPQPQSPENNFYNID
ncbi:hypothetical protein C0J52_09896, partial [Blattella germanica]